VGRDSIRYLRFKRGYWRWRPSTAMRADGFEDVKLSPGLVVDGKHVPSPTDIARAIELNQGWDRHRQGLPPLHENKTGASSGEPR
jgi:hypothetical protein